MLQVHALRLEHYTLLFTMHVLKFNLSKNTILAETQSITIGNNGILKWSFLP